MAKGGSRYGAGRPGWRFKAEQCLRLDVRQMYRAGVLKDFYVGSWRWTNSYTGEHNGRIGFSVESAALVLRYTAAGNAREQRVMIDRTRCHFGGARPWLTCPVCNRRVAVIYFRSGRFACRHCQRIAYMCQSEDATGRAWRKQGKVEAKLADDWERPTGMHQSTYERLMGVIDHCEEVKDLALAATFVRLGFNF